MLESYCDELGRQRPCIDHDFMEVLLSYPWPGNIRELESVIKRSLILLDPREPILTARALDCLTMTGMKPTTYAPNGRGGKLDDIVYDLGSALLTGESSFEGIEDRLLGSLLERHDGNVLETSRKSGISKDRLYRYLKRNAGHGDAT
jgi:transcriptional regulator of acetoin/glycerol metabolism